MMIDSKTKWSVWGMLFGMAVVLGAGVAFLAFILTRDPQILAFLWIYRVPKARGRLLDLPEFLD